jgi:hypothetical protein
VATVLLVVLPLLLIGGIALVVVVALGGAAFLLPRSSAEVGSSTPAPPPKPAPAPVPAASPDAQEEPVTDVPGEQHEPDEPPLEPLSEEQAAAAHKRIVESYRKDWNKLARRHDLGTTEVALSLTLDAQGAVAELSVEEPDLPEKTVQAISELVSTWEFPGIEGPGTCTVKVRARRQKPQPNACPCPPNDAKCKMLKCT